MREIKRKRRLSTAKRRRHWILSTIFHIKESSLNIQDPIICGRHRKLPFINFHGISAVEITFNGEGFYNLLQLHNFFS